MGDINKYFGNINYTNNYDWTDKNKNVTNYVKYMLNRSLAMFKYHNLPDTIPHRDLELLLQSNGYGAFCKVNNEFYVLNGGLGGEGDAYNKPTNITIANSYLKFNATLEIDKDCVIIPNDSMYLGLLPMYERYCTMINESDISIILATINKRIQVLLSANDDNTVQSAKQFLTDIQNGKLGVIAETKLFDSLKVNNSSNSSNVSLQDLYQMHQYLKASLYNEIGLGAINNMKREKLISAEVETNSDNLYPLVDDMLSSRRLALEKINTMFGTDIQVEFNSSWDYRLHNGEPIDTQADETGEPVEESEGGADVENAETRGVDEPQNEDEPVETTDEPTDGTNEEPTEEQEVEPTETDTEPVEETETETETETEQTDEPTEEETDGTNEDKPVEENEESEVEEDDR